MDNDALLAGLDEGQRAAVVQPSPVAVLAPAGSGKTRVLVRRVAYQTEVGALDPRRTLCVAFTREAAGELRQRLRALGMRDLPAAGTFHSIAYAQLRARWEDLGIGPKDLLTDRLSVLRRLLPARLTAAASGIDAEISWAKGRGLAPEEYLAAAREVRRRPPGGQPEAARQFAAYEKHRIASKRVDFDDLITLVTEAFETDPTFATGQRYRFRHLLLDEFQDVNAAQFRLLRAWLGPSKDVTVVGDPHQAIYGWNGADAGYLQRFEQQFPGAVTLRLGVNYRSSAAIAAVAAVLTSEPPPETNNDDGPLPQVRRFSTETTELAGIAEACRDDHASGIGWGDQAVLVRTNALAREIVEYLAGRDIPCRLLANRDATPLAAVIEELVRTAATFDDLLADLAEEATEPDASPQLARIADRAEEFAALDAWPNPRRFIDWLRTSGSLADGAGVTVATFHAAKGLEWQAVHVAALEDGFVPSAAAATDAALAEEQRLLYVALTRATRVLRCTWAASRHREGVARERAISPFLAAVEAGISRLAERERVVPPAEVLTGLRARLASDASKAPARAETLDALMSWRDRLARAQQIAPIAILPDDVLAAVAQALPTTAEELAEVSGVGSLRARRLAVSLLAVLAGTTVAPVLQPLHLVTSTIVTSKGARAVRP